MLEIEPKLFTSSRLGSGTGRQNLCFYINFISFTVASCADS